MAESNENEELVILEHGGNGGEGRCRFLYSKEMLVGAVYEPGAPRMNSGLFWCSLTQTVLGPDGGLVGGRECCSGRGCFDGT